MYTMHFCCTLALVKMACFCSTGVQREPHGSRVLAGRAAGPPGRRRPDRAVGERQRCERAVTRQLGVLPGKAGGAEGAFGERHAADRRRPDALGGGSAYPLRVRVAEPGHKLRTGATALSIFITHSYCMQYSFSALTSFVYNTCTAGNERAARAHLLRVRERRAHQSL